MSEHVKRAAAALMPLPAFAQRSPLTAMSPEGRQFAWAVGRTLTRDPDFGFAVAARVPAQAVGDLWDMYEAAPNLAALHAHYPEFQAVLLDCMRACITLADTYATISVVPAFRTDRAEEDFRAGMQIQTWRALLQSPQLTPRSVGFTYARPRSTRTHSRALGPCELRFSQPSFSISLDRPAWQQALPNANAGRFTRELARWSAPSCELGTIETHVESLVLERLQGQASAATVADALGMSERSLRRKLEAQGTSFRALADRARQRQAELLDSEQALLGKTTLGSAARAALLGFANAGALRNAAKRWQRG
jgi:AraC-like DNA-binding protein